MASCFDELPLWSAPFGLKLLDAIKFKNDMIALDIGCGTGFPLIEIAQRLGEKGRVFGVDPWEEACQRVDMKLKTFGVKNVDIFNVPAENLPFGKELFDLVVSNNGLNNVRNLNSVLEECSRVLKPGGQFVFTVNLPDTMKEFYDLLKETLAEMEISEFDHLIDEHINKKRKSVSEMTSLVTALDFEVVEVKEDKFYWRFLDGSAMFNHSFVKLYFLESWKSLFSADMLNEIFDRFEDKLNSYSEEKEGLRLTIPYACFDCLKK